MRKLIRAPFLCLAALGLTATPARASSLTFNLIPLAFEVSLGVAVHVDAFTSIVSYGPISMGPTTFQVNTPGFAPPLGSVINSAVVTYDFSLIAQGSTVTITNVECQIILDTNCTKVPAVFDSTKVPVTFQNGPSLLVPAILPAMAPPVIGSWAFPSQDLTQGELNFSEFFASAFLTLDETNTSYISSLGGLLGPFSTTDAEIFTAALFGRATLTIDYTPPADTAAVPESGTLTLLVVGAISCGVLGRRRLA